MSNEVFHFKQFSVRQDRCAMKIGTDGVLLGAWCACKGSRILDIGSGTGLISLMLAQRNSAAHIDAVEIDQNAASQCAQNFADSPWNDRLTVHALPLADYYTDTRYDLIVSNPPFYNATLKPEDEARAVARHKDSLPIHQIMQFAATHLSADGRLSLIYPTSYDEEVMTSAVLNGLIPSRICDVITSIRKPAKRRLAEFTLNSNPSSLIRESLLMGSQEHKMLTSEFYLVTCKK